MLSVLAILTAATEIIAEWFELNPKVWGAWTAVALAWFLFVAAVAWLSRFRDDGGEWDLVAMREALSVWWTYAGDRLRDVLFWATILAGAGIAALSARQGLRLVDVLSGYVWARQIDAWIQPVQEMGYLFLSVAAVFGLFGGLSWLGRQFGQRAPVPSGPLLAGLPVWVCRDELPVHASRCEHPMLRDFLCALESWPGRRWQREGGYSDALGMHLRRRGKHWTVKREHYVGVQAEGTRGRADLVVDNTLLLELKRGLMTTTADRAVGQIDRYSEVWARGPVVLIFVEPLAAPQRLRIESRMTALRTSGRQVLVLELGDR